MDEIKAALSEKLGSPGHLGHHRAIDGLCYLADPWFTKKTRAPTDGCRADGGIHQQLL